MTTMSSLLEYNQMQIKMKKMKISDVQKQQKEHKRELQDLKQKAYAP